MLFYESTALSHRYTSGPVAWARRLFLRHGAEVVLVPGQAAAAAVAADGVSLDRIVVTFNSIDQAAVESAVRRSARSTSGTYRVSYVGQLIERKNVEGLLRAFYASDIADSELHIVGQGPEEQRLKRLASELQAQERPAKRAVTWHGGLAPSAALDVMVCCDLLVLSSTEEVWGLVVNEALTAGLAVVVSESSGVAASVIGMPAVHVCQATTSSLIAAMEAACREWSGWLVRPEIKLVGAPENFATSVRGAVRLARERITSHAAG